MTNATHGADLPDEIVVPGVDGTPRTVRRLSRELIADAGFQRQFPAEVNTLRGLNEPRLAGPSNYLTDSSGRLVAVLRREVTGVRLARVLERYPRGLDLQTTTLIAVDVLSGLSALHGRWVGHRGVTPENVMIDPDGMSVLVDVGLVPRQRRETLDTTVAADLAWFADLILRCLAARPSGRRRSPDRPLIGVWLPRTLPEPLRSLLRTVLHPGRGATSTAAALTELTVAATQRFDAEWDVRARERLAAAYRAAVGATEGDEVPRMAAASPVAGPALATGIELGLDLDLGSTPVSAPVSGTAPAPGPEPFPEPIPLLSPGYGADLDSSLGSGSTYGSRVLSRVAGRRPPTRRRKARPVSRAPLAFALLGASVAAGFLLANLAGHQTAAQITTYATSSGTKPPAAALGVPTAAPLVTPLKTPTTPRAATPSATPRPTLTTATATTTVRVTTPTTTPATTPTPTVAVTLTIVELVYLGAAHHEAVITVQVTAVTTDQFVLDLRIAGSSREGFADESPYTTVGQVMQGQHSYSMTYHIHSAQYCSSEYWGVTALTNSQYTGSDYAQLTSPSC